MQKNSTCIAIIIPTFNRMDYLRIVMQQINTQKDIPGIQLVPVIVIDGSTDKTEEMLTKEFPDAPILHGKNWWWTKSVNEGAKFAIEKLNPDYIHLLNDDSQIEPDYYKKLMGEVKVAGENSVVCSISITDKEPARVSFAGVKHMDWWTLKKKNYYKGFELLSNIPDKGLFPTYALNGRGTIASTHIWKKLDFLDEKNFPQYHSDDDFAMRAWKNGFQVVISYSCRIIDRTRDTAKGTAFRQDGVGVFIKSFFRWNSVNYIPAQLRLFYIHGIKLLIPFYLLKFLLGTSYAYFLKYKKLQHEL